MKYRNRRSTDRKRYRGHSKITRVWAAFLAVFCVLSTFSVWTQASSEEDMAYNGSVSVDTAYGKLTVTADADAGILPSGAQINVKPITEDSSTKSDYDAIQKKTEKLASSDKKDLSGFLAYDISFTSDGQEVEPNGKVNVSMSWENAAVPAGTETGSEVSVLHFEKNGSDKLANAKVVDLTKNQDKKQQDNTAEVTTTGDSKAVKTAKLSVDSFSVFTITWTKDNSASTVGRVTLHYVDVNGLEINRTSELGDDDLKKTDDQVVKISDWVNNDNNGARKVSGYIFDHASLEKINGKEITGVKVQSKENTADGSNTTSYILYYTTADDPSSDNATWTEYIDSLSKKNTNNVDIYLVFSPTAQRMRVHFVDDSGNIVMNPVYKYADQTYTAYNATNGFDITNTDTATNPWAESIQDYTYTGIAQVGEEGKGWQGFRISTVRAYTTGNDSNGNHTIYRYEYKLAPSASEDDWVNMTGTDIYLIYQKTSSIAHQLTVHYVDEDGNDLLTSDQKTTTKTAKDTFDTTASNENQAPIDISTWAKEKTIEGYSFVRARLGTTSIQGTAFKQIRAQKDSDTSYRFQYRLNSNSGGAWTNVTTTDVYLIYGKTSFTRPLTIHAVDTNGNAITDEAGEVVTRTVETSDWGNVTSPNNSSVGTWKNIPSLMKAPNGYTEANDGHGVLVSKDGTGTVSLGTRYGANTSAAALTYPLKSTSRYSFRFLRYASNNGTIVVQGGDGAASNGNPTTVNRWWNLSGDFDIYLIYRSTGSISSEDYTYTVHYIDEDGNVIDSSTPKTTIAVSGSNTSVPVDVASLAKTISGYTAVKSGNTGLLGRATEETGGIPMTSMTFMPRAGGGWNYTITSTDGSTPNTTKARQLVIHNLNIYVRYKKNVDDDTNKVKIYFVDENGKLLDYSTIHGLDGNIGSNPITNSMFAQNGTDGATYTLGYLNSANAKAKYTFVGTRVNGFGNAEVTINFAATPQIKYTATDGKVTGSALLTNGGSGNNYTQYSTQPKNLIKSVYLVYRPVSSDVKVHYIYLKDSEDDDTDTQIVTRITGKNDKTIAGSSIGINSDSATTLVPPETSSDSDTAPLTITSTDNPAKTYAYAGTRVGPSWSSTLTNNDLGPKVQNVYSDNGQLMYYDHTTETLTYLRNNTWYHAENNGRKYELVKDGDNYTLTDSHHGTVSLDLSHDNTYVSTYHGEDQTTEYKVEITSGRYNLTVTDWIPNNQSDVYEIYVDSNGQQLWIDDDQKFSGYLIANRAGLPSGGTYAWYKTVTDEDKKTTTSTVLRKQTGEHYNIEYDPTQRTWLDVEADEGGLSSKQTAVSYYVTYTYTTDGAEHTVQSEPIDIQYYSELKNGDFESVSRTNSSTLAQHSGDYSNSEYKKWGGVWQTTGTKNGQDIEIVNVDGDTAKASVARSYGFQSAATVSSADGVQFAELNAEAAGALYQDVVTHPNESLHYWFSHRARGYMPRVEGGKLKDTDKGTVPEYDTMYLVIMPTKIAMTAGSDGGELKTQSDLIDFISAHGGFDYNLATSVSQEITYAEDSDGILVLKVSSNDQFWHAVRSINGYTAKAGLTRFFFTAGPTAYGNESGSKEAVEKATHGNFIDAVGFSQTFPKTNGFNLSVSKKFSGLSDDELAGLAKIKADGTSNDKAFNITISDQFRGNRGLTDQGALVALNGAQLGFNATGSSGNYTFTPTATLSGADILTGNSSGTVTRNSDGSITMTWDFLDQSMVDSNGNDASGKEESFYYTVKEENAAVTGKYLSSSEKHSNNGGTTRSGGSQYIHQNDSAVFTLNNEYSSTSASEQPQMIITKTFTGMTPTAVDVMLPSYSLKLERNEDGSANAKHIILTGDIANPIKSEEGSEDASDEVTASVSQQVNKDGSTTLIWLIKGWGAADKGYTITEKGYETGTNPLTSATVSYGSNSSEPLTNTSDNIKGKTKSGITVGTASDIKMTEVTKDQQTESINTDTYTIAKPTAGEGKTPNLIVAQYTLTKDISTTETHYFVWTAETLGANTSQAIVDRINKQWSLSGNNAATMSNTEFHSSSNPGTISVGQGDAGSISYDSQTYNLRFTNGDKLTWNKFFSTRYWVGSSDTDSGKYTDTDIAVKNSYSPAIKLLKVDSNNTSTVLAGAEFKIYRLKDNNKDNKEYLLSKGSSTSDATWGNETEHTKALTLITDNDGIADLGILPISTNKTGYDTYYLEEVKAPAGYNKLIKPLSIRVTNEGNVEIGTTDTITDGSVDNLKLTVNNQQAYYLVTIQNKAGIRLPNTGGKGIWSFIAIGIALILMAILLYRRNKEDEKEADQLIHNEYLKKREHKE